MRAKPAGRLAVLVLLGGLSVAFADVLFFGSGFYLRDVTTSYLPWAAIVRNALMHGEFPVWARQLSAGQPLAANPAFQLFYPGTWLVLLPRFPFGFHLEILAHLALAACGMYALLRELRLRLQAALFGAICFGAGGCLLSLTNLLPTLTAVAWWPLIVLFTGRYVKEAHPRDGARAALLIAAMLLAAEQAVMIETAILLVAVVLLVPTPIDARRGRGLVWIAVVSLLIASVQLVPALDLKRDSARSEGLTYQDATSWSMPALRPLEMLFPNLLGTVTATGNVYRGTNLYHPPRIPWLFSIYNGLLVAVLFLTGVILRSRGWLTALTLSMISYLLAIGANGPVAPLLYRCGVLHTIRYPEKFAMLGAFAAVVFSSTVFHRLQEQRVARAALMWCVAAILLAASFLLFPHAGPGFLRVLPLALRDSVAGPASRQDWSLAIARYLLAAGVLAVAWRWRHPRALTLLLLFAAADVGLRVRELAPRMPASYFAAPAVASACPLARDQVRIFHEADWPGARPVALPQAGEPFWTVRNAMLPFSSATWGLHSTLESDVTMLNLKPTAEFYRAAWQAFEDRSPSWPQPFLSMANAGYVLRALPPAPVPVGDKESEASPPVRVQPVQTNPRYYFAEEIVTAGTREELVRLVTARRWNARVAFVRTGAFHPSPARVLFTHESGRTATIAVDATGPALLVMSVTPHRYWRATVDGRDVPLHVVNIGFQGVVVQAGAHTVRMRYSNPLITGWGIVSIVSAGLTILVARRRPLS